MNIETVETSLDKILSSVKKNTNELLKEKHSNQALLQSATSRGMQVLKGSLDKQLYIDLCSIALTLYLQNKGE